MRFPFVAVLAFGVLLSHGPARADVADIFDGSKISTESLVEGVETCTEHSIESLKKKHRYQNPRRERLSARAYCACMLDASQALPPGKKISAGEARKCVEHAGDQVDAYMRGEVIREQDLFDPASYPTSTVYTAYLLCMRKEAEKGPCYCGCIIDGMRTEKSVNFDDYLSRHAPLKPEWVSACQRQCSPDQPHNKR